MAVMNGWVFFRMHCRSYAVDEYKKPFWEVLGLYLEEASSLAGITESTFFLLEIAKDYEHCVV